MGEEIVYGPAGALAAAAADPSAAISIRRRAARVAARTSLDSWADFS